MADSASFTQKPTRRMSIVDMRTLEEFEMQFNPAELNKALSPVWARLHPPGLSHERLNYDRTDNVKFSFQLVFDELVFSGDSKEAGEFKSLDAEKFLDSLCYPAEGLATVNDGKAPRALFIWPNFIQLTAVISGGLKYKYTRFALDGRPTYFTVDVALEEIRDVRLTSEEVRANGSRRAANPREST